MGRLRDALLNVLGDVKVFRWPMWVVYDPGSYRVKGRDMRAVIERVRPGTCSCGATTRTSTASSSRACSATPGCTSDVRPTPIGAVPLAHRERLALGEQTVIHAIAEGVLTADVLDFCRCDRLVVLRFPGRLRARPGAPPDNPGPLGVDERAVRDRLVAGGEVAFEEAWPVVRRVALAQLGLAYDFDLDFTDLRRLSCTEPSTGHAALAPFLGVQPERHRIRASPGRASCPTRSCGRRSSSSMRAARSTQSSSERCCRARHRAAGAVDGGVTMRGRNDGDGGG